MADWTTLDKDTVLLPWRYYSVIYPSGNIAHGWSDADAKLHLAGEPLERRWYGGDHPDEIYQPAIGYRLHPEASPEDVGWAAREWERWQQSEQPGEE